MDKKTYCLCGSDTVTTMQESFREKLQIFFVLAFSTLLRRKELKFQYSKSYGGNVLDDQQRKSPTDGDRSERFNQTLFLCTEKSFAITSERV